MMAFRASCRTARRVTPLWGVVPALLLAACGGGALPTDPAGSPASPGVRTDATARLHGATGPRVRISQVYGGGGNSGAPFTNDFIELFNAGDAPADLAGLSVQYTSATGTGNFGANTGLLVALGGTLQPGQYHLIQVAGGSAGAPLPSADVTGTINMAAGAGKVALVTGTTSLGCNGGSTPCSAEQRARILDLVGYGNANFFEGGGPAPTLTNTTAAFRASGGCTDTDDNAADFSAAAPAPRTSASPLAPCAGTGGDDGDGGGGDTPPPNACEAAFTPAYAIQGSGPVTPLAGQVVTTQGVVVGDFEGPAPALRGFYLQDLRGDGDPATSDAIFVFNGNNNDVALGDVVRVTGTAAEFQDQTQLANVTAIVACGTGSVSPVDVTLPVPTADHLERYEGMLVRFPQALTVTEHFQLGRFGQVVLSSGGRLPQPTDVAAPGAAALAVQAANDRNRIILDDNLQNQNPDPIVFGRGGQPLSAANTLRGGDEVTGLTGVLTFSWAGNAASGNAWRVRPLGALGGGVPVFQPTNPRPASAPAVGGRLKVASFNLLNYFNTFGRGAQRDCTNGVGGQLADCRGAENPTEFTRQRTKTLAALQALDADIVGVIEVENDGYGPASAIQDLVNGLNATAGAGAWAFIDADAATGQVNALGTDGIKVGLIYRTAKVRPVGVTAVLNSTAFVTGGDGAPRNRPTLTQAFEQPDRARLVVSVHHLKSKGSPCDVADAGDGQGDCNLVRRRAVQELLAWLATDPTDTGDPDVLIMGDLNAYTREDPVAALTGAGYVNLVRARGTSTYGYVFDGQWGSLDHALATPSLAAQVTGAADYHVSADEPNVLDYNTNFKSAGQVASLYAPDEFRASDHDPVLVGLDLAPPPVTFTFGGLLAPVGVGRGPQAVTAGSAVPLRFALGGAFGPDIFAEGFPATRPVACASGQPLGPRAAAETGGLTFSPGNGVYQLVWKTDEAWLGSCREVTLRFRDGSQQSVVFRFRG